MIETSLLVMFDDFLTSFLEIGFFNIPIIEMASTDFFIILGDRC